jgi:hypothetical protein
VETGTTGYSESAPKALLTHAGARGGGPFVARPAFEGDTVEIAQFEGNATVVWEVVSTDPDTIEDITLALAFSSDGNAVLGEAFISATIAPIAGPVAEPSTPPSSNAEAASTPSFVEAVPAPDPLPAFAVVPALPTNRLVSVSAASYQGSAVAPGSIVAAFGPGLAARACARSRLLIRGATTSPDMRSMDSAIWRAVTCSAALQSTASPNSTPRLSKKALDARDGVCRRKWRKLNDKGLALPQMGLGASCGGLHRSDAGVDGEFDRDRSLDPSTMTQRF